MRVKIHSGAPLPEHKFLLPVTASETIAQLADRVRASLVAISSASVPPAHELLLEIDGFQLLDDSTADVLEANDVVVVRIKPRASRAANGVPAAAPAERRSSQKRRDSERAGSVAAKRRRTTSPVKAVSESSSESESSSSSSSSTDSDSDSSSESDSSSDSSSESDSDSDSSSSPSTHSIRPSRPAAPLQVTSAPFQGKPSTHERNLRRRRAKMMKKLAAEMEKQEGSAEVTPAPASYPPASVQQTPQQPRVLTPTPVPVPGPAPVPTAGREPTPPRSLPPTPIRVPEHTPRARLVPPSERAVPNNVFVTSREFEFVTDAQRRKMDAAEAAREAKAAATRAKDAERSRARSKSKAAANKPAEAVSLDGIDDSRLSAHVEAGFESLRRIVPEDVAGLREGSIVAWKDLVLDTATFSPQLKVLLGRVFANDGGVTVQLIKDAEEVAYEEEEYEAEPSEVRVSPDDVAGKEYRLVRA